jgi:hypothetical protein
VKPGQFAPSLKSNPRAIRHIPPVTYLEAYP